VAHPALLPRPGAAGAAAVGRPGAPFTATKLRWTDEPLGAVATPKGRLRLTRGVGSGLAVRAGDPPGTLWAIGDRGPNLKVAPAIELYGLTHLAPLLDIDGAKIMPRPDIGPAISELRIEGDAVRVVRTIALSDRRGRVISGLATPGDPREEIEPVFDLAGVRLAADPSGADTESIAALRDGSFWIGEEYGPSLLQVAPSGRVVRRWVPRGTEPYLAGAQYPVEGVLPKIAARRRLNRGFESLAVSPDERWLYAAFQSALAHPDDNAFERARTARIWKLDADTGEVVAQYLYPFDQPDTFARDRPGSRRSDLKLCEAVAVATDRLLVLERISRTAKVYVVDLSPACETPPEHLRRRTAPSLEQMNRAALRAAGVRLLKKTLLFSTDDAPEIAADLEGMAVLSPTDLLLVNDNDFGVEGARTSFWRVRFKAPVFAAES
jgi:hypothetical protein